MAVQKKAVKATASKVKAKKARANASPAKKGTKASVKTASKSKAKKKVEAKPAAKKKISKKAASKVSGKKKPTKTASPKAASTTPSKKPSAAKPASKKRAASKAIPKKKTSVTKPPRRTKASAQPAEMMVPPPSRVFGPRSTPRTPKKGGLAQPELETLSTGDGFGPSTPMDPKAAAEALRAAFAVESPFNLHKSTKRAIAKEGEPGYGFAVAARAAADEVINAVLGELGAIGEFEEID